MRSYFLNAIADRRKEPREALLTALVQAEEERQTVTADEVLAMAMLILLAGNETTMNLLSNTVLAMLAHPDVLLRVRFFFSSRRRHTRSLCDWSSDVCSSD